MLSRQDWVEVRGAAAGEAGRPRALKAQSPRAGGLGAIPQKILKNCRKRVFQAFQALSSHFERVVNSKEMAGRTGFGSKDEPNRTVITSP